MSWGATSVSPTSHQSQMIWRWSLGSNHKNWRSRQMHKLRSGRHWWVGTRQQGSVKTASTAYVPWEQLCRPINVCQTWGLPLSMKLQEKQSALLYRKTGGVCLSLLSVQCPGGGSLPRTIPLIAAVLWDPKMPGFLATRASDQGVSPKPSATKTGHQTSVKLPSRQRCALELGRGWVWR